MPLVRLQTTNVDKSARMFTPKRITQESAWLREARKVIPEIPNVEKTDWRILSMDVSLHKLHFELVNSLGTRATITIDRKVPGFG